MEEQKLTGYPGNQKLKEMLQETSLTAKGSICPGVTLLDYFAAKAKDDFDDLPTLVKEQIVGRSCPENIVVSKSTFSFENDITSPDIHYALWLAEGRAKWRVIQANALLKELEKHLK